MIIYNIPDFGRTVKATRTNVMKLSNIYIFSEKFHGYCLKKKIRAVNLNFKLHKVRMY